MDSYRSYLNKYPKGKFYIEAIELHEEHFWNYTNKLNTVLGYDNFIAQYGRSKYIKEAYDLREDALWNASQNTEILKTTFGSILPGNILNRLIILEKKLHGIMQKRLILQVPTNLTWLNIQRVSITMRH